MSGGGLEKEKWWKNRTGRKIVIEKYRKKGNIATL